MEKRRCALCGAPVVRKYRHAKYCSDKCRRRASYRRVGALDDESTEKGRLEVARRLAVASYARRKCRCANPIGLVDEDGGATCFRCGWPLAGDQVRELPPAA